MNQKINLTILGIVIIVITGVIIFIESNKSQPGVGSGATVAVETADRMDKEAKAKQYLSAKEILSPAGFINTDGITIQELIGKKVVLVDFWTYSCINCQRTLPYLTSWHEKYRDQGLEIVGIHTPEFEFEKDITNVQRAVDQYGIEYPVVLDNEYATWRNYANRYWPRKYLIDIDGFIVYDHIGEGGYEETEKVIQQLLAERKQVLGESGDITTDIVRPTDAEEVDASMPRSPEIYFGSLRNERLGNGRIGQVGIQSLNQPSGIKTSILYLTGNWNIQREYAENQNGGAKIIFKYQGQKVFIVARADESVIATILVDGNPVGNIGGSDVVNGTVTIQEDRLYRLIEDSQWGEHTLEIIVDQPGLQAFTFTFG
jgi:thiol-disulfide isomerase/thioredoxin